jgi:ABC-2 type transport system ATP-binding protein
MSKIVEIVDVTKIFTDFWGRPKVKAVQSLNLDIKQGEIFGLLGPNGSGKSTTIKMMLGLLKPTSGKIALFGHSPRNTEIKNKIGFLPEESYLYPFLTAEEALHFFGGLFGLSLGVRKNRVEELIKLVGLEHARHRRLGEFSKGMARRIGFAQALIGDPQLLILDEPTTGLDPIGILEIKELILELKKKGKTILISSHLLSEVQDVCDRVCILYGGKVCSYGELDELLVKKEKTNIELTSINKKKLEQLTHWLHQNAVLYEISQPKENLESYFMRVISKEDTRLTGGAIKGGEIPKFFGDDKVISDLIKKPEGKPNEEKAENIDINSIEQLMEEPDKPTEKEVGQEIDRNLLNELTKNKNENQ